MTRTCISSQKAEMGGNWMLSPPRWKREMLSNTRLAWWQPTGGLASHCVWLIIAPSDIRIAIWNCRGVARVSFLPNLWGLLTVTRAPVMVVMDIRVGDDNAREILRRATMNHDFTAPIAFVGGMCIFWGSTKVFLVPHKFEQMHVTFVVKVNL